MKIIHIKINKLFDLFDYDIPLDNEENLRIITGPNGFGKTTLLNIIYNLFNKQFAFFQKLLFEKIELSFDNHIQIEIHKKTGDGKFFKVHFSFFEQKKLIETIIYPTNEKMTLKREIKKWFSKSASDKVLQFIDAQWDEIIAGMPFLADKPEYAQVLDYLRNQVLIKDKRVLKILNNLNMIFIQEQRLLRKLPTNANNTENNPVYKEVIGIYAADLSNIINSVLKESLKISQALDSSFLKRLVSETKPLAQTEFKRRFSLLKKQQEKLQHYGFSESEQEIADFDKLDSKVIYVYLNDTERKLKVFDSLLSRLEIFTHILNKQRFTFKSIKIDKDKGFTFLTHAGKDLNLNDLSSGEQHEIVLLYELLFKTEKNTLVLIDEPEISLHITWQKEFINDLLKIIKLQQIQVIMATHSPQIIHDRWDLAYNLEIQELT